MTAIHTATTNTDEAEDWSTVTEPATRNGHASAGISRSFSTAMRAPSSARLAAGIRTRLSARLPKGHWPCRTLGEIEFSRKSVVGNEPERAVRIIMSGRVHA